MAVITITEAAKKWNIGRATIYRKLNGGELSGAELPDGGRGVDTSELIRVFGDGRLKGQQETNTGHDLIRENAHLRELLAVKDEHIETLKQAMRLLEDKRPTPAPDQGDQADETAARLAGIEEELNQARAEAADLAKALEAERSKGFFAKLFKKKAIK